MGTRHQQIVIDKNGNRKISQYGQWDGYPEGQGVDILKSLRTLDLAKYQIELQKINEITEDQRQDINKNYSSNWKNLYPYLSRDCGSDIHELITLGQVKFVDLISDEESKKWCEGFYTINFQTNEFISEYYEHKIVFNLDNLPSEEDYLKAFE